MSRPADSLWTVEDVAEFCKVKPSIVKHWLRTSDIPHVKLGKFYRFQPKDVLWWIERRKNGTRDDRGELKLLR